MVTEHLSPRPEDTTPGVLSPEDLLRILLVEDDDGDAILVEEDRKSVV